MCFLNGKVNEHNGYCPVLTFCHLHTHGNILSNQIRKPKKFPISISPPSFEHLYGICLYAAKQYTKVLQRSQPTNQSMLLVVIT